MKDSAFSNTKIAIFFISIFFIGFMLYGKLSQTASSGLSYIWFEIFDYVSYVMNIIIVYLLFNKHAPKQQTALKLLLCICILMPITDITWILSGYFSNNSFFVLSRITSSIIYVFSLWFVLSITRQIKKTAIKTTLIILNLFILLISFYLTEKLSLLNSYTFLMQSFIPIIMPLFAVNAAFIYLIYGENTGVKIYFYGQLLQYISNIFEVGYFPDYLTKIHFIIYNAYLLWCVGSLVKSLGLFLLFKTYASYASERVVGGIKQYLLLNVFRVSIIAFICTLILLYTFSIIDKFDFVWTNAILMGYCVIIFPIIEKNKHISGTNVCTN